MELSEFKKKTQPILDQLPSEEDLRQDEYVNYVFETGKDLFQNDLDRMNEGWLVNKGSRLAGIQSFLGNKVSRAKAKRDIYIQQKEEIVNKIIVDGYGQADSKVTLSRAQAKIEVAPIEKFIVLLEYEVSSLESIKKACESMTSFIQSALKSKTNERFTGDRLHSDQS